MRWDRIHNVYFIGIGGIGMSALARWFNHRGMQVSGYDRTQTPLTERLTEEGIDIHYTDDPELISKDVIADKEGTLVVYTPAIPKDHREFKRLEALGYKVRKRSEVLGMITATHFTVAVAGTHGKTSTSSIISHILKDSGRNCAAFVGGIMTNYGSNLILPRANEEIVVVVEADEFDRSFLRLDPDVAVVTAADPDHLDIYGDGEQLKHSFRQFISKIDRQGKLFIKERVANELEIKPDQAPEIVKYDIDNGEISAQNVQVVEGAFVFDYVDRYHRIEGVTLHFPGRHNVENTIAAISVALYLGIDEGSIKNAVASYSGVKRRFEHIIKNDRIAYVDDYAHHPEEIKSFLSGLRELYPDRKITAIFQPHLFTRTRDFVDGFAESLTLADEVILIPIYPARELPIEGVDSKMIMDRMPEGKARLIPKEEAVDQVAEMELEVLATVGAGDIDQLVNPIKNVLEKNYDTV